MNKRTIALGLGAVLLVLLAFAIPAGAAAPLSGQADSTGDNCPGCQYACNGAGAGDADRNRDGSCTTLTTTGIPDQTRDQIRLQDGTGADCRK